jgi:hypothetical protein
VAQLFVGIVLVLFSNGPWQLIIVAVTFPASAISGAMMLKQWRIAFCVSIGTQLVFQCCAFVFATDLGFVGAWLALGIGLAILLIGDQILLSSRLYVTVSESELSSKEIISATLRSFWRVLFLLGLVMVCSLLALFLILAMDVGSLTLPLLLMAGLLVMISLYYLATRGTLIENEEKPNI